MSKNNRRKRRRNHKDSDRHFRQIVCRPRSAQMALTETWAITRRPGDRSDSFLGENVLRPLGSTRHIVLRYVKVGDNVVMPLTGYTSQIVPQTAQVVIGGEVNNVFNYDFSLRPHPGARSRILDPARNPSLVQIGLDMDRLCQRANERRHVLATAPTMPQFVLEFATPPVATDTPALRARIAAHMEKPIKVINAMADDLEKGDDDTVMLADGVVDSDGHPVAQSALTPFILREWADVVDEPGRNGNNSSSYRVRNQFFPDARRALRVWEDYSEEVGVEIRNPVLDVYEGKYKIHNPVKRVAKKMGIKLDLDGLDAAEIDAQEELIKSVYDALGVDGSLCSLTDVMDGIVTGEPIVPTTAKAFIKEMDDAQAIKVMRRLAGRHADACRDEDLLEAARNPNKRLYAAGLMRIQPLRVEYKTNPFQIDEPHVCADFAGVKPWWDVTNVDSPARKQPAKR